MYMYRYMLTIYVYTYIYIYVYIYVYIYTYIYIYIYMIYRVDPSIPVLSLARMQADPSRVPLARRKPMGSA